MKPLFLAVAALSAPLIAQAAPLGVGSPAPALKVAKWVKGTPVKLAKGKLYVVEFWATWCGPCIQTIPHLSELAKKYKGKVTFTGVSVFEHDPKYAANVVSFVEKMGPKMAYNVAMDDDSDAGFMAKNWMIAAQQNGIPTAFVVGKDGKIAWIGHPIDLEKPLALIVAGKYDVKAEAAKFAKVQAAEKAMADADRRIKKLAGEGKWAEAVVELDKLAAMNPDMAPQLGPTKFQFLLKAGEEARAFAFARKFADGAGKSNPMLLNALAWQIVDDKTIKTPDYALALEFAQKASALTGGKDWQILDTLAVAQSRIGDLAGAIATETKAIDLMNKAPGIPADSKKELTDRLAELVKAKGG